MDGWVGKILFIDLTEGRQEVLSIKPYLSQLIGGRGIGAKLLYDYQEPNLDPFDPGNLIVLSTGPLTGTSFPGSGRVDVTTKSPLTSYRVVTNIGGYFGPELKFAGYDHLMIKGKAKSRVYIYINNDEVRIMDAAKLWGKMTYETMDLIRKDLDDPDAKIISIGPAGENLVRYANIISEMGYAAGRGGVGAVMGSKNLKAIAVRGTRGVSIARPRQFLEETMRYHDQLLEGIKNSQESEYFDGTLDPRVKRVFGNYEEGEWEPINDMDHEGFMKGVQLKRVGCFSCPKRCMHLVKVEGMGLSTSFCSPLGNFSRLVWNNDLNITWQAIYLVNQYGLDSLETGGVIAYLMELYERGLIDKEFSDGIPMEKGSKEAILKAIHKIANSEGFGKKLKDGIDPLANELGECVQAFKVTVHNMVPHGYYFPAFKGAALIEAVGHSKGDCFPAYGASIEVGVVADVDRVKKLASPIAKKRYGDALVFEGTENLEAVVKMVIDTEHMARVPDIMGICYYIGNIFSDVEFFEKLSAAFYYATGVQTNEEQLLLASERLRNIERLFDVREGMSRGGDYLPERFFKIPIRSGIHQGKVLDEKEFERMKDLYYDLRGWDRETGCPKGEKLRGLGLVEENQILFSGESG